MARFDFEAITPEELALHASIELRRGVNYDSDDQDSRPAFTDEAAHIMAYGDEAKALLGPAARGFKDTTHVMKFMLHRAGLPLDIPDEPGGNVRVATCLR